MKLAFAEKRTLNGIIATTAVCLTVLLVAIIACADDDLIKRVRGYFGIVPDLDREVDFVRFIDVGQGDCALIQSNGRTLLIDTGDLDTQISLCSKLNNYGISRIDATVISHFHMDHIGGLEAIAERFFLPNLIMPVMGSTQEGTDAAKSASVVVRESDGGVYTAVQGMNFILGDFDITVLYYPDIAAAEEENDRSLFLMAKIGDKKFLFTGDAEAAAEEQLLGAGLNIDCDVLKVAHHGSASSTGEAFLDACTPEYAAISCGKDNTYGHPDDNVLSRLEKRKIELYRTDISGDITFYVENGGIRVETEY